MDCASSDDFSDWEIQETSVPTTSNASKNVDNSQSAYGVPSFLTIPMDDPNDERMRLNLLQQYRDVELGHGLFDSDDELGFNYDSDDSFIQRAKANYSEHIQNKVSDRDNKTGTAITKISMAKVSDINALIKMLEAEITGTSIQSKNLFHFLRSVIGFGAIKLDIIHLRKLVDDLQHIYVKKDAEEKIRSNKSKKNNENDQNHRRPTNEYKMKYECEEDDGYSSGSSFEEVYLQKNNKKSNHTSSGASSANEKSVNPIKGIPFDEFF